jgi:hypothetical protein
VTRQPEEEEGTGSDSGVRRDLGELALFLAEGDVTASAQEAMQTPYREALEMTARLSKRNADKKREMERRMNSRR